MDEELVDKVEIVFEKESGIFHDGDHVSGMVLIRNNDDIAYKCELTLTITSVIIILTLYTYLQLAV